MIVKLGGIFLRAAVCGGGGVVVWLWVYVWLARCCGLGIIVWLWVFFFLSVWCGCMCFPGGCEMRMRVE